MKKTIKTIGKDISKIGRTTLSGDGWVDVGDNNGYDTVAVRDYVAGKGYGGAVGWDGENATVGGRAIKPLYVKDGTAYVSRADADDAIKSLENESGIKKSGDIEKMRDDKYGKYESDVLGKIINRDEFSYDPQTDKAYQAYKNEYTREAVDALRRVLNENNTSLHGASGAVLSEALASHNAELLKLADKAGEFADKAYERYADKGQSDRDDLKSISELADAYYERIYKGNSDLIDRVNEAGRFEQSERQRWTENGWEDTERGIENEKELAQLSYYDDVTESELRKTESEVQNNTAKAEAQAMENASARGFFTRADEALMPWLSAFRLPDGSYSVTPSVAEVAIEYKKAHARERGKLDAKLGR